MYRSNINLNFSLKILISLLFMAAATGAKASSLALKIEDFGKKYQASSSLLEKRTYLDSCLKYSWKSENDSLKNYFKLEKVRFFLESSMLDSALGFNKLNLELIKNERDSSVFAADVNNLQGIIYDYLGDYSKSLKYHYRAKGLAFKNNDRTRLSRTLYDIALVYSNQGKYQDALNLHYQSLRIKEELKDSLEIANSLSNISYLFYYLKDYSRSLEYQNKSLEIRKSHQDLEGMAISYSTLGKLFHEKKDYKKALDYYKRAYVLDKKTSNRIGISDDYTNIARVYIDQNENEKALATYQKALELDRRIGNKLFVLKDLNNIGILYMRQKRIAEAKKLYEDLNKELGTISNNDLILNVYFNTAQSLLLAQNFEKANSYFARYNSLKDSLFSDKLANNIATIKVEYEMEQKDKERIALIKEMALQKQELEYQKMIKIIFIILFVSLSIIATMGYFIFVRYKRGLNN